MLCVKYACVFCHMSHQHTTGTGVYRERSSFQKEKEKKKKRVLRPMRNIKTYETAQIIL